MLEQLNEMDQSANNSTTVNDSNKESSKSEHDELTTETNDEIQKFIAEMERENTGNMSKPSVDMSELHMDVE